jgi:hypothetical protein
MNKESEIYTRYRPGIYLIKFETGFEEEVQADSQQNANAKANHLQGAYGPIKSVKLKPKQPKTENVKSYAEQQSIKFN